MTRFLTQPPLEVSIFTDKLAQLADISHNHIYDVPTYIQLKKSCRNSINYQVTF